jgi:hypothetical protein
MNAASKRGLELLIAHCASLDPATATAHERVVDALGAELATKLVWALCSHAPTRASGLDARAVFAA